MIMPCQAWQRGAKWWQKNFQKFSKFLHFQIHTLYSIHKGESKYSIRINNSYKFLFCIFLKFQLQVAVTFKLLGVGYWNIVQDIGLDQGNRLPVSENSYDQ